MRGLIFFVFLCGWIVCADSNRFSLMLEESAPSTFTVNGESAGVRYRRVEATVIPEASPHRIWGYAHDYRAFTLPDINGQEPATNGHVHATGPWFHTTFMEWRFELAPSLRVSSNVLRDQQDIEVRDVEPAFRVTRQTRPAPFRGTWEWGVQADSRLGTYQLVPVLAWVSAEENTLQLLLGFPDSHLTWLMQQNWEATLRVGPAGGQWRVRDRNFAGTSTLDQERWRIQSGVTWHGGSHLRLTAGIEMAFGQRWEFQLEDGVKSEITPPDDVRGFASVQIHF